MKMSESMIELFTINDPNFNNSKDSQLLQNFYNDSLNYYIRTPIYSISKNEFTRFYHFLCKKCYNIPILRLFFKKIKYNIFVNAKNHLENSLSKKFLIYYLNQKKMNLKK